MWHFKDCKPPIIKPVCKMQPTHEVYKQVEEYRRYILASLECYYNKILQELSVTDPESLATLHKVITEYKEIESSIDAKLEQMEEMLNSFIETYQAQSIDNLQLKYTYDEKSKNLSYHIGKKGD